MVLLSPPPPGLRPRKPSTSARVSAEKVVMITSSSTTGLAEWSSSSIA